LNAIPAGFRVSVFGANLKFESVLLKGVFSGFKGGMARMKIDKAYNSMPPKHAYIFATTGVSAENHIPAGTITSMKVC